MSQRIWAVLGMMGVFLCGSFAGAQSDRSAKREPTKAKQSSVDKTNSPKRKSKSQSLPAMTPARETAALTFARRHHPELADLLTELKKNNASQYKRAVRHLSQAADKLARTKERSPERYELSLKAWKLDSRIRLLVARMTMKNDPAHLAELKAAMRERFDIRLQQVKAERERLAKRLEKLDQTVDAMERGREAQVQKVLEKIKRRLDGLAPKSPRKPKTSRKRVRSTAGK